jgi:hypothetical protein
VLEEEEIINNTTLFSVGGCKIAGCRLILGDMLNMTFGLSTPSSFAIVYVILKKCIRNIQTFLKVFVIEKQVAEILFGRG